MVNTKKLKARMVEHDLSASEISKLIGMDRSTFYRKMQNNGENFTILEANAIANVLNLTKDDVNEIFFAQTVA